MKIQFNLRKKTCKVFRKNDKKIYSESAFFYELKLELRKKGFDVIKKSPAKDGHLTSASYYIRERRWKFVIWDGNYQIRNIYKEYNNRAFIHLTVQ